MKNLKRILSLALAGTMLVGMMMVGASAADFTDQDSIDHKAAVDTLVALGVLHGNTDGTFNPKGGLTRAEMATVIATINNRGVTPNYGTKTTPTFADTKGHWAEGIIEYCYSFKLVNGESATRFNPDGKLTATEAARMILNTMGYTVEDPTNWKILTEVQARNENIDLYAGLDDEIADPSNATITRDQMAQMAYNAMSGEMADGNTYKTDAPVYGTRYSVVLTTAGKLEASVNTPAKQAELEGMEFTTLVDADTMAKDFYSLTRTTHYTVLKNDSAVVGTKEVDTPETLGHKFLAMDETIKGTLTSVVYDEDDEVYKSMVNGTPYDATEDYSALIGQNVKVVVKRNSTGGVSKVYGITANKGKVLFTGTIGDIAPKTGTSINPTDKSIKVKGVEYKIDEKDSTGDPIANPAGTINLFANNEGVKAALTSYNATTGFSGISNACTMKGIDTNGDGKLDRIEYLPVEVVTVTNVTTKAITTNPKVSGESSAVLSIEADNVEVKAYEGIAKNDVVAATPKANTVSGKVELAKTETTEGVAADAARSASKEVRINGKWFKTLNGADYTELAKMSTSTKYDLVMVNGYIAKATAQSSTATSKDMLIVTAIAATDNLDGEFEFRAVLMDGTAVTGYAKGLAKTTDVHKVYTYTVKDGNKYTLKAVTTSNTAGYDKATLQAAGFTKAVTTTGSEAPAKIANLPIADDAVIVVRHDSNALATDTANATENTIDFGAGKALRLTTVLTGADVKKWNANLDGATDGTNHFNVVFTSTVNGIEYVKAAILYTALTKLPGDSAIGENVGYVVSDAYAITDYNVYDIWNGEEVITVKDEATTAPAKGDVITYDDKGDGVIDTTSKGTWTPTATGAVVGYDKGIMNVVKKASPAVADNGLVVDEDTVILYVDAANVAGQETGAIVNALEDGNPGKYFANVKYLLGTAYSNKHVDILLVDVNGNIDNVATADVDYTINVSASANAQVKDTNDHFELTSVTYNGVPYEIGTSAAALNLDVKIGDSFTATLKALDGNSSAVKVQVNGADVGELAAPSTAYTQDQVITVKCTIATTTTAGAITLAGTT